MTTIRELTRIRQEGRFWVVEVLSPVANVGWIVQGEHLSKDAAEADRKNWDVKRSNACDAPTRLF